MNYELLQSTEIPRYITKILSVKSRQPKYFKRGSKELPKKYQDKDKYDYRLKKLRGKNCQVLTDLITNEAIISNPLCVGTPGYLSINTQKVYSGFDSFADRGKVVNGLKDFFNKSVTGLVPITGYPLYIEYVFHTTVNRDFDVDNMSWIYIKVFHDWLRQKKFIPDDTARFILKYSAELVPVETEEETKLVINFYKYPQTWADKIISMFRRLVTLP